MDPVEPYLRDACCAAVPSLIGQHWTRLRGGRVNRVWRVGGHVVKLYDPGGASPLFPNDGPMEARMLARLGPDNLAPVLAAEGPGWIVYRHVRGRCWSGDPRPVARLLTRLHAIGIPPEGVRTLASGSDALRTQGAAMGAGPPPVGGTVDPVSGNLLHGDAVPGNIIMDGARLTLIDWQCPALGDPVEDMAMFLSPAMQWLYRGAVLSPEDEAAFLDASPPDRAARYRALATLFHWRMIAHCCWKADRGDADYARAALLEADALRAAVCA